ncbi:hypothetical protein [Roseicella sp. DB1501]|uniref:hypothetical protein n=1 Tax=Roseicella sp. DB1501 TaxID=2730925 RepID=UPI0020C1F052|nr:hypothetical protein [Roseicella sp. DB1501]
MQTGTPETGYEGAATAAVLSEGAPSLPSRVSWGAVIAGAVVALTIGLMLNALGAGIGATTVDAAARDTPSASSFGIGAAIWVLVSNLIGLAVGGYAAARLSGTSDNTDGTLHGLAVWGTSFLISAALLGNLVSGIASTAATGASNLLGGVAQGAGSAVSAVGQQAANRVDTGTLQAATQGVVDRVQEALNGAGGNPAAMTSDQRKAEIGRLATRRVTDGQLPQPDRDRLNQLVAAEYGISPQEAQARVQQAEQQATQAAQRAEETARRAADATASGAARAAFAVFGIMLLGAIASVLGARRGTRDLLTFRGSRVA